ncbi:CmcI family methyltransferase [Micromonospora echinofusca]|uniref:CmcI family methyltransferase n=1 Tax=Micromonospora echinofusca TaxID=47858 RepID=UPI000C701200|nr:CmcI family methyltransferase [Micromonospora sp. MSM11]MCL7458165.1 cephalosporin hydroxylase family protein [Micromonospora sp. MSM11]
MDADVSGAVDTFQRAFYKSKVWRRRTWLGVACHQNPMDMWMIQEIIHETRPDLIIETGTRHGGSALYYATMLGLVGNGRVATVDVKPEHLAGPSGWIDGETMAVDSPYFDRVDTMTGSSVDPAVVAKMREKAQAVERVMVILDSDHSKRHVLAELEAYADLVTPGCYLIVQDTNLSGHPVQAGPWEPGDGPWEALEEFLPDQRFEVDRSREELMFTWFPGGYLRRV